jgi:hypothetical protein
MLIFIIFIVGEGYFSFLFEIKEDRDLIFRSGSYLLGAMGMYPYQWTPDFIPENDVPLIVPMWVRFLHLPLHCWIDDALRCIGNSIGKSIDHGEPKGNIFSCARICVEVDL